MNFKSIWLYAAMAACLGGGYGIRAATSPSQADMDRAVMQYQQGGFRADCEMTDDERRWKQGKFQNRPSKGY
jgi:hypothetical protein